jgi:mannose-1-phosphate guanylyltransferase
MADERYAVILAGGKGERFWPQSTSRRPKQLLELMGDTSLLAQAVDRLEGLVPPDRVFVLTNAELVEACWEAAPRLPRENIVGEPVGRDTAPAVALGGALVGARDPDASFCVVTADQLIGDLPVFQNTLRTGMDLAAAHDVLMTIGIQPAAPSTGFGYVETGIAWKEIDGVSFFEVEQFVEKPDSATAESYLARGTFYWNSGMFIWSVPSLHRAFSRFQPELAALMDRLSAAAWGGSLESELAECYPGLTKISIDYALMEHAANVVMAKGTFSWDDVGSWTALADHFPADEADNTSIGQVASVQSSGNIVFSKDRLTALVGVEDLIVVQADGVTLVCAKERSQEIKKMVEQLRNASGYEKLL